MTVPSIHGSPPIHLRRPQSPLSPTLDQSGSQGSLSIEVPNLTQPQDQQQEPPIQRNPEETPHLFTPLLNAELAREQAARARLGLFRVVSQGMPPIGEGSEAYFYSQGSQSSWQNGQQLNDLESGSVDNSLPEVPNGFTPQQEPQTLRELAELIMKSPTNSDESQ